MTDGTCRNYMKIIFILFLLVVIATYSVHAKRNDKHIKQGWSIIPFPALSYNSDLGLQYGACCDIFYFGNGSAYPDYRHKLSFEVSRFTKGSGVYRFFYDSEHLLPGTRLTADVSYLPDKMLNFYGFNGYASPYLAGQPKSFYNMNRDMFRLTVDFQRRITGAWKWAAGFGYYNYRMGAVKFDKYSDVVSLYRLYRDQGIINPDEARGGNILQLKGGIVYDSRDTETDPTRGIWSEAVLCGSPDWIDRKGYDHLKLTAVLRQYVPLAGSTLTFAYRLGFQGTLAGHAPFYVQSNINTLYMRQTYSEGLGGTFSLRGIYRNRIVGDGMAWMNAELRLRFLHFRLFRQNWYFVVNPFADAGMVVTPFRKERQQAAHLPEIYSRDKETLHGSAGVGAKAVMNQNFVLSVEWGQAFDHRDGGNSLNFYMNFLF